MMSPRTQKIILVSSGILTVAIIVLGIVVAFQFFGDSPSSNSGAPITPGQEQATNNDAPGDTEQIVREAQLLLDQTVVNATINDQGDIRFYQKPSGQVYLTDTQGAEPQLLDETTLTTINSVEWAPGAPVVITNVNDRWYTFNYAEQRPETFSENIIDLQFLGNSRVFYLFQGDDSLDLSIADTDASNRERVISLSSPDVVLQAIPSSTNISQTLPASAFRASSLRIIDTTAKEAVSVLDEKFGLTVSWAPNGQNGIISYTLERGGADLELALIDDTGFELQAFPETNTIADKVVWSRDNQTIYYTQPNLTNNRAMPDDYLSGELGDFTESLYRLNTSSGERTLIASDIGSVDSRELFLSPEEDRLFFINKRDDKIYFVDLE